jgi:2-polyprenyl-3-methyl-5-hydroxy-6-metoxy-1,4-benzoquinol methylase
MANYFSYFKYRNINPEFYSGYKLPKYLIKVLPANKNSNILDIGCGFGMSLSSLKILGYKRLKGIDSSDEAIKFCIEKELNVEKTDIMDYCLYSKEKYDFIIMSHVLEHIKKTEIIETLETIRSNLLNDNGYLCIMVPNAQSNTGSYWAYEDFTHQTLFTTGSIIYVLKAAGFNFIKFIDPKGIEDSSFIIKILKVTFLQLYKLIKYFWNKVTSSSYHKPSPIIFTYELKVLAGVEK